MALRSLLNPRFSIIKNPTLPFPFGLIPTTSPSSLFSSQCKRDSLFSLPSQTPPPPVPKKVPFTASAHGTTWQDPYRWMSNTDDPDLLKYLHDENSYAQAFMADTETLQRTLLSEMKSRMPPSVSTPPERWGPWLYYQYIPEGKEYPVLCRQLGTVRNGWVRSILNYVREFGREEILLDWNEVAEQYGYVHVGTCRVSPDHNFLAYTLDITGDEQFILQIKDLRSGSILPKLRVDGVVSLAWAQDGATLFYTISDENQRPWRVLCTRLGSDSVDEIPLFTESDSSFCVDITATKDGKFITVYVIDATNPQDGLRRIHKRVPGVQYFLEHHYGFFYVLTNAPIGKKKFSCGEYYLARCRVEDIQSANWQIIILPSEDISLQDMDIFNGHLVLFLDEKGFPRICSISMPINVNCKHQMDIENLNPWFFPLPSSLCRIVPGSNHDFMNSVYRMVLSSPVVPDMIVDYDMSQRTFSIVQQEEVLGISNNVGLCSSSSDLNTNKLSHVQNSQEEHFLNIEVQRWKDFSGAYCCERKEVVSHDDVKIPLTILYSRDAWKVGESPGLLYGYGAYGEVLDKSWCPDRLSLLDRGWLLAFADVRGGGGGGGSWHEAGRGLHKLNSIHDFVSCGKHLGNEGYVHRDRLAAIGFSAGGFLLGAAINMCPDLFRAAILRVPFLDVCNTLLDATLPLTILDYEEFGNPQIQLQFESISSYSPYDNISQGCCYPSMLVAASFHDSRVGVWEAAKWVGKVRDSTCPGCSQSVILKTNMTGGHFSEGGRFGQCEETAYEYAFLMKTMGIINDSK